MEKVHPIDTLSCMYLSITGRMASDQSQNMFVEEFELRDPHTSETIRVLNLERFDLGKVRLTRCLQLHSMSLSATSLTARTRPTATSRCGLDAWHCVT